MSGPRVLMVAGTPRGLATVRLLQSRGVGLVGLVVMQEDDHEQTRSSTEIAAIGAEMGVPVTPARRLDDAAARQLVEALAPELVLVVGWRTLLPQVLLEQPRLGCVGVHDSPLPAYRGFAPVNWAVINGERRWAVSLFHLAEDVDAGDLVDQEWFDVPDRCTAPELYRAATVATVAVVERQLEALLAGTAPRTPQDHASASYACARTPEDGKIDWTASTEVVDRLVRGLTWPYPGAWTTWKGQRLSVLEAEPVRPAASWVGRIPGRVVSIGERSVDVLTGDGVLRVTTVALDGEDPRSASSVVRSIKGSLGS